MKYILSVLFLFFFFSGFTQIYQEMPQYGYRANRMAFDSTLQIPTVCGVPTLKSVVSVNKKSAIAFDSCNNKFYTYNPKTQIWSIVSGSSTASPLQDVLTAGHDYLDDYGDTLRLYEYKNVDGIDRIYPLRYIDNGEASPSNILLQDMYVSNQNSELKMGNFGNFESTYLTLNTNELNLVKQYGTGYRELQLDYDGLKLYKDENYFTNLNFLNSNNNANYEVHMPIQIENANDTLTTLQRFRLDTANKWVNNITRTSGKDSIIFFIGSTRYAIKDSVGTNPAPVGYYGAFQDNTSQTAASINTAYAVKLNTTDLTNGVSVVNDGSSNPTRITLANTGIYNIQFSLQLEKTGGSGNMIADIWIRKNGVDIPSTTGKVVLTGSANASPVIAAWNYVLNLVAGDYVQLMWATSNTNVEIVAAAATSPHPAIPSAILTVTQQSGIMAGTGITAINSLTGAAQTMVTGTDSTDFRIVSTGTTHKFNLPTASATNRGALSSADWTTFNNKLNISDTSTMLSKYLRKTDTASLSNRIDLRVKYTDTATMLTPYLRKIDTTSLSNRINLKLNIADTSSMLSPYLRKIDTTNRFVNNISRTVGKDSIIFNIGSTRYAIKDSVGSGGTSYTFSTGLTNSSGTVTNNLSTGVSGGQSVVGGTAASNSLTLSSTSNATKGKLLFGTSAYDEVNNRLGIGTASPTYPMSIEYSNNAYNRGFSIKNTNTGTNAITGMSLLDAGGLVRGNFDYAPSNFVPSSFANTVIFQSDRDSKLGFAANASAIGGTAQDIWFNTLGTNTTYAMQIKGNGNVQINTNTDAGYRFDVNGTARVQGALNFNPTNTASGTTGNQTINKASGTVNIAAAGTTVTVTNSLVSATSIVFAVIRTNDATATIKNVVPAAGSFVINLGAAATAETSIGFFVIN